MNITYHKPTKKAHIRKAETSTPIKKPTLEELGYSFEQRLILLDILIEQAELIK